MSRKLCRSAPATGGRPLRAVAVAALHLALCSGALAAQEGAPRSQAAADSLIQYALERARAADTAAALRALERATKVAPNYARAFYQRGLLLSNTLRFGLGSVPRRREALQHLDRALDLDPGNPLYLLEIGRMRQKTPFLSLDAERMFNKALQAAESRRDVQALAEVHFQLGRMHERRYTTIANRHLVDGTIPFDPGMARADVRYVRDFLAQRAHPVPDAGELDLRNAESHYRAALLANPAHEGAAFGLFGLLAELRRDEELLRATDELRASLPGFARRYLARGLALHLLGRDVEAEPALDSGLALLPAETRRDMTSLATILRRRSAAEYDALAAGRRAALDSAYWDAADPLALSRVNEARTEFLPRIAYADLRFSSPEFGHEGWRTDRGIAYARYGPPTRIASFMSGDARSEDPTGDVGRITTVWWYEPTNLSFVFTGPPAMGVAWFADDFRAYAESVRETAPVRFEESPRLRVDSVGVQVARFRPDAPAAKGDVDVSIFADVPSGRLLRGVDVVRAPVVTGFLLRDDARRTLADARDSVVPADTLTPRAWRAVLPGGEYQYRVEALQPASGHGARAQGALTIAPIPTGQLALSDVIVARAITPRSPAVRPRGRADFDIEANGSLAFARRDTIFLYWEEYDLARDPGTGAGRSRVELSLRLDDIDRGRSPLAARILGGISDAIGMSAEGDNHVSLRFDRSVPLDGADRTPGYLAVALGDAPAGTYTLELTVTDLVSGRTAKRQRVLTVPRP